MANSVVPNQTHSFAASDVGQHCLLRLSDYYGISFLSTDETRLLVSENILYSLHQDL